MVNLHLDPVENKKVFDHLIEIGKISSKGHIGTHLDCYTCAPDKPEYELSAVVLECKDGMPDAKRLAKLGMLQGKALTPCTPETTRQMATALRNTSRRKLSFRKTP